jgi:hypothetical protein
MSPVSGASRAEWIEELSLMFDEKLAQFQDLEYDLNVVLTCWRNFEDLLWVNRGCADQKYHRECLINHQTRHKGLDRE